MKQLLLYLAGFVLIALLAVFAYYAGRVHQFRLDEASYISRVIAVEQPTIKEQQQFLNSLGNSRYYCGKEDNVAGPKFCRAVNNYQIDQEYMKSIARMASWRQK